MHFDAQPSTSLAIPAPFSTKVKLSTPFLYEPAKGTLAVDFQVSEGDDFDVLLDAGGRSLALYGPLYRDVPLNVLPGLVLQLQVQPVPEPSTVSLILIGISVVILCRRNSLWHRQHI
jgi:hypothetical protein